MLKPFPPQYPQRARNAVLVGLGPLGLWFADARRENLGHADRVPVYHPIRDLFLPWVVVALGTVQVLYFSRLIGFQQFDLVLKVALVVIFSQIQPLYRIRGLA